MTPYWTDGQAAFYVIMSVWTDCASADAVSNVIAGGIDGSPGMAPVAKRHWRCPTSASADADGASDPDRDGHLGTIHLPANRGGIKPKTRVVVSLLPTLVQLDPRNTERTSPAHCNEATQRGARGTTLSANGLSIGNGELLSSPETITRARRVARGMATAATFAWRQTTLSRLASAQISSSRLRTGGHYA